MAEAERVREEQGETRQRTFDRHRADAGGYGLVLLDKEPGGRFDRCGPDNMFRSDRALCRRTSAAFGV